MGPVIGVVAGDADARWGSWHRRAVLLPASYVDRLSDAGALPVLVPPVGPAAATLVPRLDGILLAGGGDLSPSTYGGTNHPRVYGVSPVRDETELAVTAAADDRGLPILAICRGVQLLNVSRGGTLHGHLPDIVGHDGHSGGRGEYGRHQVTVTAGSRLAGAIGGVGPAGGDVATHHHQAIDRLGRGLTIVARADDGTVEAVEDPSRFVVGVQWHPEVDQDGGLFQALVAAVADS
jgi:putative glutamine amidotransferase